ncbi:protein kinase C-like 1 [Kluyveromyces marxianus DMKU3-1042]|uniref:Protein kinase C-like 1 n=1 Tax=Kluyveromyces marxianus (strain DMKU3-1042 / BCC 29191 / NBRC 104275) TaxID=1003335 RepID=W0TFZ4_KLUMD|nr:protein kinase C-like 1 [Kluyveromyces marxianus DMKU3-1042]BAO41978.1 protein kinase C-like 1 [Kluyveromyces marxianus DMKU3-1042]
MDIDHKTAGPVEQEIYKKIDREKNIIFGSNQLKKKTDNVMVIQKCNTNIREAQQNIEYLEDLLKKLKLSQQPDVQNGNDVNSHPGFGQLSTISPEEFRYSRLDLVKYDCPSLSQRIQYMLQQLEFKLQVEKQYQEANDKLTKLYQIDGDQRSSSAAQGGSVESKHRIQLLTKSLKKYQAINVDIDPFRDHTEEATQPKFRRKQLSGTLTIGVTAIRDVDHIQSPLFSRKPETFITIKVDDAVKAKTKPSRNDRWHEDFNIVIDKGNEVEVTIYDKVNDRVVPVAVMWLLLSDIAEEIRKKKVGQQQKQGQTQGEWVQASRIVSAQSKSDQSTFAGEVTESPNTTHPTENRPETQTPNSQHLTTNTWFVLEPAGQILLTLGFSKSNTTQRKNLMGGLHRHGAIVNRKEDVYEQHGHHFVQKSFYNIMCCAYCGEFLRYTGYQCQDCKFLCHKKCYSHVVTKCIAKTSNDSDPEETKLNHRIPHRFVPVSNRGTKWCCHCGYILPWGKKNVRKCTECGVMCHAQCAHLVPDFCGMSMEMANKVLLTIQDTKRSQQQRGTNNIKVHKNKPQPKTPTDSNKKFSNAFDQPVVHPGTIKPTTPAEVRKDQVIDRLNNFITQHDSQYESFTNSVGNTSPQNKSLPFSLDPGLSPDVGEHSFSSGGYQQGYTYDQVHNYQEPSSNNPEYSNSDDYNNVGNTTQELRERLRREEEERWYLENARSQEEQTQQKQLHQEQSYYIPDKLPTKKNDYDLVEETVTSQEIHSETPTPHSESIHAPTSLEAPSLPPDDISKVVSKSPPSSPQKSYSSGTRHKRKTPKRRKVSLDDFVLLKVLGKGNFGKVLLARSKNTNSLCAIKVLKKDNIIKNHDIESARAEKKVFLLATETKHPFLTNLYCSFQTENRIYFAMEFIGGGDLMWHVQNQRLSVRRAKFYAAEVLLSLKYFHDNGVIYRDLKLENILLTPEGHIKIADYGLCKDNMWYGNKTSTFCGTPEFMAPEILKGQAYTKAVDWWAFGVLLYQMLLCQSPFSGDDEDEVFNAILTDEPLYPIDMAGDIVQIFQGLLTKDPEKRLGAGPKDALEVMAEPFFSNINFDDILNLRVEPPFVPEIKAADDTSYFEKEFTSAPPTLTPLPSVLSSDLQEEFRGFSFMPEDLNL